MTDPKTIALYGGSFNPPHLGHVLAATAVLQACAVDQLWVMPVWQHPLGKQLGAGWVDRLNLCQAAFGFLGRGCQVRLDEQNGSGRTFDLLQRLQSRNPHTAFRLIIGSDILNEAARWHRFDDVAAMAPPIVLQRPQFPLPQPFDGQTLPISLPDVSSRELRLRLEKGQSIDGWVPRQVADYIALHGLYRGGGA